MPGNRELLTSTKIILIKNIEMLTNQLNTLPRLTSNMQELLMDCHEKELMKQDPCDVGTTLYAGGLLSRGLLEVRPFITANGKRIMAMYVTDLGRQYLSQL